MTSIRTNPAPQLEHNCDKTWSYIIQKISYNSSPSILLYANKPIIGSCQHFICKVAGTHG